MIPFHEIEQAVAYDRTLRSSEKYREQLAEKYIKPQSYSRKKLYDSMFAGKPVLFNNYPLSFTKDAEETVTDTLIRMLKEGMPQKEKVTIRTGPSRTIKRVSMNELIDRWVRRKAIFGVPDLHFRKTKFYHKIDAEAISYFNLLPHCPYDVSFLEMLTLVISSKGIFTDSHSDDGDGSNHCFIGKKLWFIWDSNEGRRNGVQDSTFDDPIYDQAKFSIKKFVALKNAYWFVISENQTVFMPGNFTHKVITMEPYIGFGSFYVSLPGYYNTLKRWILSDTSYVKGDFLKILNKHSIKKIKEISTLPADLKEKWGLKYLSLAAKNWQAGLTDKQIAQLSADVRFKEMLEFSVAV